MPNRTGLIALLLIAATPAAAQQGPATPAVTGDAAAGLVSRTAAGEVHLVVEPRLNDRRAVLKLVVLNHSGTAQALAPEAVSIAVDGEPVAVATRAALVDRRTGSGAPRDPSQSHAAAAMPVNSAGQTDVSGYTGGIGAATGGVPNDSIDRGASAEDAAFAAQLDAVLLKSITIRPGAADGGQLFTDRLKRKVKLLDVTVTFAGEVHRFRIDVPR